MVLYLHPHKQGTLAQMVEQWTENPCVPGSIPGGTTKPEFLEFGFFVFVTIWNTDDTDSANKNGFFRLFAFIF